MMDTKELLTYAAKACGIEATASMRELWGYEGSSAWNPATDQADSDRMGTKLHLNSKWGSRKVTVGRPGFGPFEELYTDHNGDENAALRAARLRCAAEIGKGMES